MDINSSPRTIARSIRTAWVAVAALLAASGLAASGPLPMARPAPPMPGDAALRARYALPTSRFMDIDGEPIHYVDQGQGPALLLIHGSYSSLSEWSGWAAHLKRHYRVIRFDSPPDGLSGPAPDGNYGIDRELDIVDTLTSRLGLKHFMVISTSSGSITGVAYAALHPQRVTGLIFGDAGVGHLKFDPSKFPAALREVANREAGSRKFHTPEFWRQILLYNIDDASKVTPELVQEWTSLNNRALRMPHPPSAPPGPTPDRTPNDLRHIGMPTLILWGADDHEVGPQDGRKALALIPGNDKQLVAIPHCGHMLPIDCGDIALQRAMGFIDRIARANP